jgi:hypothetical protein
VAIDASTAGTLTRSDCDLPVGLIPTAQRRYVSAAMCFALTAVWVIAMLGLAPSARADMTAYLVNVQIRPGYNFPNAQAALDYGYSLCDKVSQGLRFRELMGDVKADFNTSDDYQASYLISQAVNELCPALIWQLRNSATLYRLPSGATP